MAVNPTDKTHTSMELTFSWRRGIILKKKKNVTNESVIRGMKGREGQRLGDWRNHNLLSTCPAPTFYP